MYYAFNHSGKARKITCLSGCHLSSLRGPKQRQQHATSISGRGQGLMATQLFVRKKKSLTPGDSMTVTTFLSPQHLEVTETAIEFGVTFLLKHPKKGGSLFSQNCQAIDFQMNPGCLFFVRDPYI